MRIVHPSINEFVMNIKGIRGVLIPTQVEMDLDVFYFIVSEMENKNVY